MSLEFHNITNVFLSSKILKAFNYKLQFIVAIFFKEENIYMCVCVFSVVYLCLPETLILLCCVPFLPSLAPP